MPEYVVGRRVTRYETVLVVAGSGEEAVERARREGGFGGAFEEAEYDVLEATTADVVELDGRRPRLAWAPHADPRDEVPG